MQVIDVVPPIRPREELLTLTCHKPHAEAKLGVTVSSFEFPGQSGVHNLCRPSSMAPQCSSVAFGWATR